MPAPYSGPILFFDGVCNLCSGAVQFMLRHDRRGELKFASLQSELARELLPPAGVDPTALSSLVYYENGRAYTHSSGALRAFRSLGGPLGRLYHLRLFPRGLRDRVYDFIADHRYRWFGREDECWLPTPEYRARFLG